VDASPVAVSVGGSITKRAPAIAGDGDGNLVVAYEKCVLGNPQIVARPITITSGISVGSESVIINTSDIQRGSPAIAYGGGNYLLVWEEGWCGEDNFVAAASAVLDPGWRSTGTDSGIPQGK